MEFVQLVENLMAKGMTPAEAVATAQSQQDRADRLAKRAEDIAEAEKNRLADEAKRKAEADEAEKNRLADEAKRKAEADEAEKNRLHELKRFNHEKTVEDCRAKIAEEKNNSIQQVEDAKLKARLEVPRHKKYQGLVKFFTKDDEIGSWMRNLESILKDEQIPEDDWAFVLRKNLTSEPLRVIETVPDNLLNNYRHLKRLLDQHFKLTEAGQREKFRNLSPKSNQTFLDFVAETKLVLENWIKAAQVNGFDDLKELMVKDKILAAVPNRLSTFLIEQGIESLERVEQKGTAFCDANKDIFASGMSSELNIGAAATFYDKQKFSKGKPRKRVGFSSKSKAPLRGTFTECLFCHNKHGDKEMCESNPEYKGFSSKHIKKVGWKNQMYTPRRKCWCCHAIGHVSSSCPCRHTKQFANFTCEEDSYESSESTDSETMHDELPTGNACEVIGMEGLQQCEVCRDFHESAKLMCGHEVPYTIVDANAVQGMKGKLDIVHGYVNDVRVSVLRDTGSTLIGVKKDLVSPKDYTGEHVICRTFGGEQQKYHLAWVRIKTPFLTARTKCAVLPFPCTDLIVGNVPGAISPDLEAIEQWEKEHGFDSAVTNAVTRQQTALVRKEREQQVGQTPHTLPSINTPVQKSNKPDVQTFNVSQTSDQNSDKTLQTLQRQDTTLVKCWENIDKQDKVTKTAVTKFVRLKNILHRLFQKGNQVIKQIVLPVQHRQKVLEMAHSSAFGGHMGINKTLSRVQQHYYWPGLTKDIKILCRNCKECQTTRPEGKFPKATLQITDTPGRPFEKVAIDIIGPMRVPSNKGNMYVLTLVDLCTRWPEALPMRSITSEAVAEALLLIFSRVGFPNTILSDNGPQFVSQAMRLTMEKLGIKQVFSSPYHPQTNGTVERFNGTLKSMLSKVTLQNPSNWDVLLPSVLFAFREVPQESTKFSPFELLYGANPRGPLCIYKELLTGKDLTTENKTAYELVTNIRDRVITACELAGNASDKAHEKDRVYKNVSKKTIVLHTNDWVLLLLPKKQDKLCIEWQGPFQVVDKVSDVDYRINVNGKQKVFHVNMLAKYHKRDETTTDVSNNVLLVNYQQDERLERRELTFSGVYDANNVVSDNDVEELALDIIEPVTTATMTYKDVKLCPNLSTEQRKQVTSLLKKYSKIFSDIPGKSKTIKHHIRLTSDIPVKVRPYTIPEHYREKVETEIKELEKLKIIQRSTSNYSSSMVVIKKKDNSIRICIDYRKLNEVTITDAEPIPGADELISTMSLSSLFSKLDMTKGYYQIPMTEESKHLTAFSTSMGLYEFNYMPFGLVNAPATFVRMTRQVLRGISNVATYIDDMCIHTDTFERHIATLAKVFEKLQEHGLTVKPVKVEIAFPEISFLGHTIKQGTVATEDTIVSKILNIEPPKTRKHVQALLGLLNYYSKFIPCFAEKTAVLSSLLKKEHKKIIWTDNCQKVLDNIKKLFSESPILKLPDYKETFVIRTDASNTAISGCLGQYYSGILHPCLYVSRKLTGAEKNYSTVELEALAVIYTITKLKKYLLGKLFLIQSDNQPLRVITSGVPKNARIARWALILQDYQFKVSHIEGSKNCLADLLSRL